jgi:DNA polymerase-3 subunit alpha
MLSKSTHPIGQLAQSPRGAIKIAGVITKVQKILTKKGDQMAFADVEDKTGTVEVLFFPTIYAKLKDMIIEEKIYIFEGKVNDKDGTPKFLVDDIRDFINAQPAQPSNPSSVTIKIPASVSEEVFVELKKIFEEYPGDLEVNLMINQQKVKTPFKVNVSDEFRSRVASLFSNPITPQ